MSETKTKEQRLEIFKDEYKSVIRRYEREVEKYTLKMNEDYEYFFRWWKIRGGWTPCSDGH